MKEIKLYFWYFNAKICKRNHNIIKMSKGYFAIGQAGIVVTKEGAKYLTEITDTQTRAENSWFAAGMKPGSATRIKL